jgi:opacity protein-like surface antigen
MRTSLVASMTVVAGLSLLSLAPHCAAANAQTTTAPTAQTATSEQKTEFYVGLFMQGSMPNDRPLKLADDPYTNTSVQGGLGGGLKFGLFPTFTAKAVGLELELSGLTGKVEAPTQTSGGITRSASARLNQINAMGNLLFRYPGEILQPYVGVGAGLSGGFARSLNLQNSSIGAVNENAGDGAFAYQLIGGLRGNVSEHLFLFSEYKYFVANYQWESEFPSGAHGPSFTLNYRAHIVSGGLGFRF